MKLGLTAALAAMAFGSVQASADVLMTAPTARPKGDVAFKPVSALPQTGSDYQPQLRGGQDAKPGEWPASLYVKFIDGKTEKACTAALIGPFVMLTAAHCVPESGKVTIEYPDLAPIDTTCTPHPSYGADPSADFALCKLHKPFPAQKGFKFESVSNASMESVISPEKYVVLAGFGCTSDRVAERDTTGGTYQVGYALVDESSDGPAHTRGATYYSPLQRNNLFTVYDRDVRYANVCPGDSGGPAFLLTGGDGSVLSFRTIIGVNSRVFFNASQTRYTGSLISATGGPDFRDWAKKWAKAEGLAACGLSPGAIACR